MRARLFASWPLLGGLFLFGGLLPTSPACAQPTPTRPLVSGQVVDGAQHPLAGVSVWIPGTTISTSTNAEGQFLLPVGNQGQVVLRFDLPTYLFTEVVISDTTQLPLRVKLYSTRPPVQTRRRP